VEAACPAHRTEHRVEEEHRGALAIEKLMGIDVEGRAQTTPEDRYIAPRAHSISTSSHRRGSVPGAL
jgi:hypothetical protein